MAASRRIQKKYGNADASFGGIVTGRYPRARAAYYFNNASLFGHARQVLSFDNLIFGVCGTPQAHLANVGHCGVAEQLPHVIR
jgi:hypothetical protein